ncbi:MAG: signal recognition particle-docking protein FtsY [Candidatus Hydrothermarchaeota archaeon]
MFEGLKSRFDDFTVSFSDRITSKQKERHPKIKEKMKGLLRGEIFLTEDDLDDILFELEMNLLESNVALEVAEEIKDSVKKQLVGKPIKITSKKEEIVREALKKAVHDVITHDSIDLIKIIKERKSHGEPTVILFVGVNGSGKTLTIAKFAKKLMDENISVVLSASDTFRAGAIEQLEKHANNLGIRVIKHKKGSDPAAVAFDALKHAKAKNKDAVLIDTSGRMQTNIDLMNELKKIGRVVNPDFVIFVGDALAGNDVIEQAKEFDKSLGIDASILAKVDADTKGGTAISLSYVLKKPIVYLGVGQGYDDLREFNPEEILNLIL